MKKSAIILILLLIPIASAVEFDMKTEFKQGETILAKLSGNLLEPILKENIHFYRGHVAIPVEYDITKINDEYYIYAVFSGKTQNNYSLTLENIKYMKGAEVSDQDIVKNFLITNTTADFSANPGFIVTNQDFSIKVQNLQENKITITSKFNEQETPTILKSGEIKKINFKLEDAEQELTDIELSSTNTRYEIPVYIYSGTGSIPGQTNQSNGQTTIPNITTGDNETYIPTTTETCAELQGKFCNSTIEECEGDTTFAKDGVCCLGTCEEIEKPSSIGKIIGWSIVIIVVILLAWFFLKKYRGTKRKAPDLLKIAKGKK